jgi:hypothetical protein
MEWKNKTFEDTDKLIKWANKNNIDLSPTVSFVIQDTMGSWHLFHLSDGKEEE